MKQLFLKMILTVLLTSCANLSTLTQESTIANSIATESSGVHQENNSDAKAIGTTVEVVGGNEESLREFIVRWLTPIYPSKAPHKTIVKIGGLQDEWPLELPMPEDARVVASITGEWADYVLMIDTGLSPDEVQDFYAQELSANGWKLAPTGEYEHGFVSQPAPFSGYCIENGKMFLNVGTLQAADGKTDLRLNLFTDADPYMCEGDVSEYDPGSNNLIPSLKAPEGVLVQGGSEGGSDTEWAVTAQLKTESTSAELAKHYNRQLESVGWEMVKQGDGEGAAWSVWSLTDEQGKTWSGTLIVVDVSDENNSRYALLRIERNP